MCKAYDAFYKEETPIPTEYIKRALKLILQENSFEFNEKNYLQTHGTAMGTKMAVAFANIFMGTVESQILRRSVLKPLVWKRYINDIFSIWNKKKAKSRNSLNKQIATTPPSSLRLKYLKQILRSSTQAFTKAKDSLTSLY